MNSYDKMYGGYSTHSLPSRNAENDEKEGERDIPKYVDEKVKYFEKEKGYEPDLAWAVAWSIYCKYKKPDSPRCKQDDYFKGRKASARVIALRFLDPLSN